jgi:hypothetical protein
MVPDRRQPQNCRKQIFSDFFGQSPYAWYADNQAEGVLIVGTACPTCDEAARMIYRIDGKGLVVTVVDVVHRRDAHRA